ncbi:hypothetical protein SAMN05216309_11152 [Nitrosomonas europaea]|nr:hypothetical protein SAMN05216310_11152 [Nitrosomonas europaea]SES96370.1 hypothetical protein SAMN05216309_11152 [Nitrosomonas europaea]SJZ46206.1 hypothetical protein SAMN02745113_00976 [Nitrosomonas europaea]
MSARASVQLGMLQNIGCFVLRRAFKESLKNYLRCHFCVKNRLKMLIYYVYFTRRQRLALRASLELTASSTFFRGSLTTGFAE